MIWASACLKSSRTFSRPRPPAPTRATLTLSLGGTKPLPPRTCRGTMVNTAAAVAPALRKERREVRSVLVMGVTFLEWPRKTRKGTKRKTAGADSVFVFVAFRVFRGHCLSNQLPPRPVLPVDEGVRLRAVLRLQRHRVPLQFLPGP